MYNLIDKDAESKYMNDDSQKENIGFVSDGSAIITQGIRFGTVNIVMCETEADVPKDNPQPNTLYLVKDYL